MYPCLREKEEANCFVKEIFFNKLFLFFNEEAVFVVSYLILLCIDNGNVRPLRKLSNIFAKIYFVNGPFSKEFFFFFEKMMLVIKFHGHYFALIEIVVERRCRGE